MDLLDNPIRHYAWGSRTALAAFLGREPTGEPEAELWIGAHPGDPSRLEDGRRLDEVLPERLPFLMKVLAVDEVLSLQVHPSAERARAGHAREEAAGIPIDAPHRNYRDAWHKPELLLALTPFETLTGFRDVHRSAALLRLLGVPWAARTADRLEQGEPAESLRAVVAETLRRPGAEVASLIAELTASDVPAFEILRRLASRYPDDPAVLVALLLNDVVLEPGDALYVAPGVVHAHSSGLALEIQAASDNVLRAGLTPKHRDIDELLAVTDFTPGPAPVCPPGETGPAYARFITPAAEFELVVGRPPLPRLPEAGPRILLSLDEHVEVTAGGRTLSVPRGRAVFLEHADGPATVTGRGWVAVGAVPPSG